MTVPETRMGQPRYTEFRTLPNQFMTQTRLNLLPQLANVAHGDIPLTTALR